MRVLATLHESTEASRTRQYRTIQAVFEKEGRPLTPREVHQLLDESLPRLGLATIYRNIKRLVRDGRLDALELPGYGARYVIAPASHRHAFFLCTSCGRVFRLDKETDTLYPSLPEGFVLEGCEVIIKGRCAECGESDDSSLNLVVMV